MQLIPRPDDSILQRSIRKIVVRPKDPDFWADWPDFWEIEDFDRLSPLPPPGENFPDSGRGRLSEDIVVSEDLPELPEDDPDPEESPGPRFGKMSLCFFLKQF